MTKVRWAELLPWEFEKRQRVCPIVYVPFGLCEPHGQISALGLDTIKADWLCDKSARRNGGIVAPTVGYTIHECGFHARWLEDEIGEGKPYMTSMPPDIVLSYFLYQLRSFANAGFKGIIAVSGHSGGNQEDLRLAARRFSEATGIPVCVASDPELVEGSFVGDHAGKYEISQLLYLRPDLIDMKKAYLSSVPGSGGRLALGEDYKEASAELGQQIMHAALKKLGEVAAELAKKFSSYAKLEHGEQLPHITYEQVEQIWLEIKEERASWTSCSPKPGQLSVSDESRWKSYEYLYS
jgi:creatinine amidohydrolase